MRNAALALTIVLALLAAGCGSGSKKSDGRLSHSQYVQKADALCRASQNRIRKLERPATSSQAVAYLDKERSIQEAAIAKIRELEGPKKDAAQIEYLLVQFDKINFAAKDAAAAIRAKSKSAFSGARFRATQALTAASAASKHFGLTVCGKAPGS